ncbi:hypothetical protein [Metabacillus fastidiosus]|uniref:hypothetical protein n=1 Tax=Metabacillus fastidiosus TaxID=1458 RepID=UPI003D2E684A
MSEHIILIRRNLEESAVIIPLWSRGYAEKNVIRKNGLIESLTSWTRASSFYAGMKLFLNHILSNQFLKGVKAYV